MIRRLGILAGVALVVAAGAVGLLAAWVQQEHPQRPGTVEYEVERGATLRSVARDLTDRDLLESPWQLRIAARWQGGADRLKAGTYELSRQLSARQLLSRLVEGAVATVAVTLPEGWTAEQIVSALSDSLEVPSAELQQLVLDPLPQWRERFDIPPNHGLEGYLFPETYRFARGLSAPEVLEVLLDHLAEALDRLAPEALDATGLSTHELLTLASIVEAETRIRDEGPFIAAVYLNRIEAGWRLEADPTIAYALRKQGETITYADLETDSPYNTYRVAGLPPGPINSPGESSVRAVVEPAPDFEAMYFVADGTGRHNFSRTWEEHKQAVQEHRRWRRQERAAGRG